MSTVDNESQHLIKPRIDRLRSKPMFLTFMHTLPLIWLAICYLVASDVARRTQATIRESWELVDMDSIYRDYALLNITISAIVCVGTTLMAGTAMTTLHLCEKPIARKNPFTFVTMNISILVANVLCYETMANAYLYSFYTFWICLAHLPFVGGVVYNSLQLFMASRVASTITLSTTEKGHINYRRVSVALLVWTIYLWTLAVLAVESEGHHGWLVALVSTSHVHFLRALLLGTVGSNSKNPDILTASVALMASLTGPAFYVTSTRVMSEPVMTLWLYRAFMSTALGSLVVCAYAYNAWNALCLCRERPWIYSIVGHHVKGEITCHNTGNRVL